MAESVFEKWCNFEDRKVGERHKLHLLREVDGARFELERQIDDTVISHYEDPRILSGRIARVGMPRSAELLRKILPQSKKARSGHLGEIFATEATRAIIKTFHIPIKRQSQIHLRHVPDQNSS